MSAGDLTLAIDAARLRAAPSCSTARAHSSGSATARVVARRRARRAGSAGVRHRGELAARRRRRVRDAIASAGAPAARIAAVAATSMREGMVLFGEDAGRRLGALKGRMDTLDG